jgi:AsmA protein
MRRGRIVLIVIALVMVLPVAALGIFIASFDANAFKPRIQDAVLRATGRALALNGPISLKWSLVPTIEARDVALANIDGGSRPQMVTAQDIEAEVALLPLLSHRIAIPRLALLKPDVLIETTPDGRGNWVFVKPAPDAAPAPAAAPGTPMDIDIQSVTVEDGTLTWRNGATGQSAAIALTSLDVQEPSNTSPITFTLVATYAGTRLEAKGETGSAARLRDTAAKTPWPVKLTASANGAALSLDAQSTTPLQPLSFSVPGFRSGHRAALGAGPELQRQDRR